MEYKRANAIMVPLLMCLAPAGSDLVFALRASSLVVSSHASQTYCLTEKRALAVTSRGLEASSGCRWVSHMQGVGDGWGG